MKKMWRLIALVRLVLISALDFMIIQNVHAVILKNSIFWSPMAARISSIANSKKFLTITA